MKKIISLLLTLSLFLSQFTPFLTPKIYASSGPWTQTDWVGGSGQTNWSDATKYDSSSNVTTSTIGQATLTNTEELSNTGFESDLTSWDTTQSYTLNDQFTTALSAGSVNGTSAEPTGGTRTVTDASNVISIASGTLVVNGTNSANNGMTYPSVSRTAGTVLRMDIPTMTTMGATGGSSRFGFSTSASLSDSSIAIGGDYGGGNFRIKDGVSLVSSFSTSGQTENHLASVMRSTGGFLFRKNSSSGSWNLEWIYGTGTAALFPKLYLGTAETKNYTVDNIRIPSATYIPVPLVSDGFSASTTDGTGHAEANGPVGSAWTGSTWTVSGGSVSNSPTLGSEMILNPDFETGFSSGLATSWSKNGSSPVVTQETTIVHGGSNSQKSASANSSEGVAQTINTTVGNWYQASIWMYVESGSANLLFNNGTTSATSTQTSAAWTQHIATSRSNNVGRALLPVSRTTTTTYYEDDASVKPLTLSSLFRSIDSGSSDVLVETAATVTKDTQGGVVLNLDSASSPANFVYAYHDGTNARLDKVVAGTYTNLISATTTYSAGAILRVIKYGTSYDVYYNGAKVGSTATISDAGITNNTLHGLFSTYSGNTFDNFVIWPRSGYTDAPFDELTATRDTVTTYSSSAGSAKLVASGTDGNFTQSVNVGDTNSYNLSAYAYTDGSAVTSSDLSLYANGVAVSTTYTSVGSGWYQLTGTVTGTASSVGYGVRVKAGKTVYVDNLSLNSYASGSLTSSIFDTEFTAASSWGTLTYTATTPTNTTVTVKARTSNDSGMSGATAFSSCTDITSGSDISSNTCVTDGQRYIQYQVSLANTVTSVTPTLSDISITFSSSDSSAPSISLTALTPDPTTDITPTISGTATEAASTVTAVEFQMDATSGSWSSCVADDGTFDESTETFTCTASTLSDGSHTVYVKATDSNGNTTASDSYASDTFTVDATAPTSIDLDSPGDNSYTNSERPTFKWKATSDATAGLSKYVLEIDNPSIGQDQPSGDFTIDNIPVSRTTDYETNRYTVNYENFSDSDSTNNYISIYTKSHNDWGSDANDGKLREGKVSWKVKAIDNAGNEASSSRTLFVDRNQPKVELTQINDVPFSSTSFLTTDKTPTIYGKITDPLAGGDTSLTQDENGPRVASGPKQVDIKVEKKEGLSYKLVTLYTINIDKPWYTCDEKEVSDNSKQKCDKYLPFKYTSRENLDLGTYRITLTGKDKADNLSNETTLTLNITAIAQTTVSDEKVIDKESRPLPEEMEITKPVEPSTLEEAQTQISEASKNIFAATGEIISAIFDGIIHGIETTTDMTGKSLVFVVNKTGQALAFIGKVTNNSLVALYNGTRSAFALVGNGVRNGANVVGQGIVWTGGGIRIGVSYITENTKNLLVTIEQETEKAGKTIGYRYNSLAGRAPGVAKTILTGIGNGVSETTSTISIIAQNIVSTVGSTTHTAAVTVGMVFENTGRSVTNVAGNIAGTSSKVARNMSRVTESAAGSITTTASTITKNIRSAMTRTGDVIASTVQSSVKSASNGIANIAFSAGEKTDDVSHSLGTAIIKVGYLFVPEPTKITNVRVAKSTPTSMTITWETNHPANGKVNYGLTADYGQDVQSDKRITQHVFTVTGLEPNTTYYYEVMSQNRNYVYDATHTFTTPER